MTKSTGCGQISAGAIEAFAEQYDKEYRGGAGRGEIDRELAERLAAWFNSLLCDRSGATTGALPQGGGQ